MPFLTSTEKRAKKFPYRRIAHEGVFIQNTQTHWHPQYFTDCVKHATPCQMLIFHRWPLLINIDTCACVYCVCVCVPWSGWLCFFGIQTTTNFMILRRNWRSGSHTHLTFHITISQYIVSVCVFVGITSSEKKHLLFNHSVYAIRSIRRIHSQY